jgi:hypothetical protein
MTLTECPNEPHNWRLPRPAGKARSWPSTATTARLSSDSFSTVRTGSRPGGCPRPMRRSWLRRNRLQKPSGTVCPYRRVFRSACCRSEVFPSAHFFGEAPERRPWAIKREDRSAAFAGRSKSRLLGPSGHGDTAVAYTGEYPIHPHHLSTASAHHGGGLELLRDRIGSLTGNTFVFHVNQPARLKAKSRVVALVLS